MILLRAGGFETRADGWLPMSVAEETVEHPRGVGLRVRWPSRNRESLRSPPVKLAPEHLVTSCSMFWLRGLGFLAFCGSGMVWLVREKKNFAIQATKSFGQDN